MIDITVKIEAGPELKDLLERLLGSESSKKTFERIEKIQSKVEKGGKPEQEEKSKNILFSSLNPEEKVEIKKRALELSNNHKPMEVKRVINAEFPDVCVSDPMFYHWKNMSEEKAPEPEPKTEKKEKPETGKKPEKPVTKSSMAKGSSGLKIDVDGLKPVKITTDDLLVVNGNVMCPKSNIAVPADECQWGGCGGYIAMVRSEETDEPHIRCTKAGGV